MIFRRRAYWPTLFLSVDNYIQPTLISSIPSAKVNIFSNTT